MITEKDARQLRLLLEGSASVTRQDEIQWQVLEEEIERAKIVPPDQIPANVVTMYSRVRIVDMRTGEQMVYQIVYPREANYAEKRISILAPLEWHCSAIRQERRSNGRCRLVAGDSGSKRWNSRQKLRR
jgi:regulator of nucleoside diphosphate kinase